MTRLRLVSAAATLLFVVTGTAVAVLSSLPLDLPTLGRQPGATTLEVRLAETQPAAGLREAVLESGLRIYLRPEAVVTGADVTSASVVDAGGRYSVNVAFSSAAANRLTEATKIHIGRPIAILLNGKVISAPTLRSTIRGSAVITGDFTRAEAERIASGLAQRGAAAAGSQDWNAYVRETQRSLAVLANETGGRAYFPNTPEDARIMMDIIARDLREQYTLAYLPSNAMRNGTWRSVRVLITPPKGYPKELSTNYRHGYFAPEPSQ